MKSIPQYPKPPKPPRSSIPTLEELNETTQRVCLGFYPNRTIEGDSSLTPEERIAKGRQLALYYAKLGEPIPACLLTFI